MGNLEDDLDYGLMTQRRQNFATHILVAESVGWDEMECRVCHLQGGLNLHWVRCSEYRMNNE